ncbi:Ubiquitin conjugation factor E4 A [Brachionus plicatilis]|uniref:Ubiquitin conjugation factor E4 A n=1 Tax=Brachionus plicatilis TaxID=10195 RepID=A0A3M7T5C2_BRAPC|nr:Ubiquitin conjugation factor E4 A [Brachionus plicatilis]
MNQSNPFATLIQNPSSVLPTDTNKDQSNDINNLYELVFQITLNPFFQNESKEAFLFMGEDSNHPELLSRENLDEILLQRLMLTGQDFIDRRIPKEKPLKAGLGENQFFYLFESFTRLENLKKKFSQINLTDHFHFIQNLIIDMSRTAISVLESEQDSLSKKFYKLITTYGHESELFSKFYHSFIKLIDKSENFFSSESSKMEELVEDPEELKFLNEIFYHFNQSINVQTFDMYSNEFGKSLQLLKLITGPKLMKYLFVHSSFLPEKPQSKGQSWQTDTLIGKLLTPSVLPLEHYKFQSMFGEPQHQFRYFLNTSHMTRHDIEINEKSMHQAQSLISSELVFFFYDHLIKTNSNAKIRNLWLRWCSRCMTDNKAKCQEWSNYGQNAMNMFLSQKNYPSEGFWLNLLEIFLNYSMPFCANRLQDSSKLLKINYNYTNPSIGGKSLTLLDSETKFIPSREAANTQEHSSFNFITDSFFYTHNLIRFSYLSLCQKLTKINSELAKWQEMYQDLAHSTDPQMSRIKTMFENMSCEFLNLLSVMIEEGLVKKMSKFLFNTSLWLSFVSTKAQRSHFSNEKSQPVQLFSKEDFLEKNTNSFNLDILSVIPEFLLTNIVEFLTFVNRFKETLLPELFLDRLATQNELDYSTWYLYLILAFMGRPDRLFNPHIRAQIAESIECLLPRQNAALLDFQKVVSEKIFLNHECSFLICDSLINVFVSIEMSGQSVQFEQKFNYRRPMYELFEYLWNLPSQSSATAKHRKHRDELKRLADYALTNIESHEQPLFLKFLNYLINDANYLLVEGLLLLEKIKTSQDKLELDKMEKSLSNQQRSELESGLKQMVTMAKFHNFMSLKTIQTIKMLTTEIKAIFCHQVLVDRIATMLNDFLLHLVGKNKRKQLKVRNFDEVKFKPKEMVSIICDIYLNLGENRQFCEAICRDGRSYSPDLFQSAIQVLEQIGRDPLWIEQFVEFYTKVDSISEQLKLEEASFDDAPDEFLDPIMSCLMEDPVLLPSSKQIVDKSTISRHLLSDQNDPFNRAPLTLQEVVPATDLKKRIDEWKKSKLNSKS